MKAAQPDDAYKYDVYGNLNSEKKVANASSSESLDLDKMKSEQKMLEEKLKKISLMEEKIKQ